ncbi:MAG: YCF48-related protein [Saprospiraceae bacterium]
MMIHKNFLWLVIIIFCTTSSIAQNGWKICNGPPFSSRLDDIYMVNTQTGYAVCGDGQIVKTNDGGDNWYTLTQDPAVYCRSVEFIDEDHGFVGGFPSVNATTNILRRTSDGGNTWEDLTPLLDPGAIKGICGLSIVGPKTIYGCGNWYQDSAYIVKSVDGGDSWQFIDMSSYATSLIDMYFISPDVGFATGKGPLPLETAVILYTTDGGATWACVFQNNIATEYCWKIQHLTADLYFASIEDFGDTPSKIVYSEDGGMTWNIHIVNPTNDNIEGVGFVDPLHGWTGGGSNSYETIDGGFNWLINNLFPGVDRIFRVNDNLVFATAYSIWKYSPVITGIKTEPQKEPVYSSIKCNPNPVDDQLLINVSLSNNTHAMVSLFDEKGLQLKIIDNEDKARGEYSLVLDTKGISAGIYFVILKTHEEKHAVKVVVSH